MWILSDKIRRRYIYRLDFGHLINLWASTLRYLIGWRFGVSILSIQPGYLSLSLSLSLSLERERAEFSEMVITFFFRRLNFQLLFLSRFLITKLR
jgi:hypothetical protein